MTLMEQTNITCNRAHSHRPRQAQTCQLVGKLDILNSEHCLGSIWPCLAQPGHFFGPFEGVSYRVGPEVGPSQQGTWLLHRTAAVSRQLL